MRKDTDLSFVSLLQNEIFLNLVNETNGIENQLDVLEREFPGQREAILYAVEFLSVNKSAQRSLPSNDLVRIWQNMIAYAAHNKGTNFHRLIYYKILKIAAVVVFILAATIFLFHRPTTDSVSEIAVNEAISGTEAMIILSDGSMHKLDAKDSKIEYSADGSEVVVKNINQKEKIEISNTSKVMNTNQVIVPFGRRHTITLSDGTKVQLNSDSRLVFPAVFSGMSREVYLKGEGYFEVFKNPDKPFIVKTDFIDIKAFGTTFNISAYEDEQIVSAVLVEGKVVISQTTNISNKFENKLTPGQGCFYNTATNRSAVREVDLNEYVSWKDGVFLFKDKPLFNIVSRVEKYYNRKIQIEGEILPPTLISGKLVLTDKIDDVVQYLAKTLETNYEENDKGIFIIKNQNNKQ